MARGGARTRSGPAPDPNSGRSDARGIQLTALPSAGYKGRPPGLNQYLIKPTARHRKIWTQLWSTPQAAAWSLEPWRWPIVADLVKYVERTDHPDCPASYATSVRQLRDDLGLSAAGLKANGWAIATDEVKAKRQERTTSEPAPKPQRRLRSVPGAQ